MAAWCQSYFFDSQLDINGILCVKFQNSDMSGFGVDAGTTKCLMDGRRATCADKILPS